MKTCTKCKILKPLNDFPPHKPARDGLGSNCRECTRAAIKMWRVNNREKMRKIIRSHYARNRDAMRRRARINHFAHHKKSLCRQKAYRAVRKGELKRLPCRICGNVKVQAHHEDYSAPLDVIWLCSLHHAQLHANKFSLLK